MLDVYGQGGYVYLFQDPEADLTLFSGVTNTVSGCSFEMALWSDS